MKQVKNLSLLIMASLMLSSCGEEENLQSPIDNTEKVELGITAGVALTKSAIDGGEQKNTTSGSLMGAIAVYAKDKTTTTSYQTGNNYALYTRTDDKWAATEISSETPKIYLTSDVATIYAYHPAYKPNTTTNAMETSGTALKITGTLGTDAKIPVTVFEGGTDTGNSLDTKSIITVPKNFDASSSKIILSAPGEVDYMWAEKSDNTDKFEASNGKASGTPPTFSVALNMKHTLSMVSFRIYNNGHYNKAGHLTQIKLENASDAVLSKGTNPTMDIASGSITPGNGSAATFTRIIKTATDGGSNDYYELPKQGASGYEGNDAAKNAAATFSILVLPDASAVAKNTIKVTFTIDGEAYSVNLAADATTTKWEAGKNNIYTVKLSGQELTLSSVTVAAWSDGPNKDLDVK